MISHMPHISHLGLCLRDAIARVAHEFDTTAMATDAVKHSSNYSILVAAMTGSLRRSRVTNHMQIALQVHATLAPSLVSPKADNPRNAPAHKQPRFLYSTAPIKASSKLGILANYAHKLGVKEKGK